MLAYNSMFLELETNQCFLVNQEEEKIIFFEDIAHSLLQKQEGTAWYTGQLLAPDAEGFGLHLGDFFVLEIFQNLSYSSDFIHKHWGVVKLSRHYRGGSLSYRPLFPSMASSDKFLDLYQCDSVTHCGLSGDTLVLLCHVLASPLYTVSWIGVLHAVSQCVTHWLSYSHGQAAYWNTLH